MEGSGQRPLVRSTERERARKTPTPPPWRRGSAQKIKKRTAMRLYLVTLGLAVLSLIINPLQGQKKAIQAEAWQKRQWIFVLEEPQEAILRQLTYDLPHSADRYRAQVEAYNALWRELLPKLVPLGKAEPLFLTWAEVQALPNKSRYLLWRSGSCEGGDFFRPYLHWRLNYEHWQAAQAFEQAQALIYVCLAEKAKARRHSAGLIFSTGAGQYWPEALDIYAALGQFEAYLALYAQGRKGGLRGKQLGHKDLQAQSYRLQGKTLLLDRRQLAPELSETQLREVYPYALRWAEEGEIERVVRERDPQYVWAWRLAEASQRSQNQEERGVLNETEQVKYRVLLFDAETLAPLAAAKRPRRLINLAVLKSLW